MTPNFDFKLEGLPPLYELGAVTRRLNLYGVWEILVDQEPNDVQFHWTSVFESRDAETAESARKAFEALLLTARRMVGLE